ncbi:unnamed protein product [Calicophoron daubneyi]|uniref:Uncharacterized protein n=1 Tax=Calicophoron daubneyi TaxID=300641 RepID=A0AAV2TF03_CALDB
MEEELEEIKDTMEKNDTVPGLLTDESGRPNDTGDLPRSPGPSVDVPSVVDEGLEVLNSREKNNIKHTKVDEFPNNWFTDNAQLVYIGECRSSNTVPSGYYLRHLGNEALSMRHCVIGTRGIHPFCVSMCSNIVITTLDLTDTWLSDECVPDLCLMFKENTTITNLNLSENRLSSKCAENLCDVLASSTQLEKLDLHQNLFDDGAAQFFGELIATSLKLAYINLSHNHLGSPSAIHIGRALPQANSLFDLDLSWNRLGGPGMKQFCKGLGENKYLKTLNLAANGLGPKVGCYELALALKLNKTLRSLELSDNRISAEGSVLLSKGMYVNSTLNFLGMARNPMQTAGCYAILNGILKNSNCGLQELDLQVTSVRDSETSCWRPQVNLCFIFPARLIISRYFLRKNLRFHSGAKGFK